MDVVWAELCRSHTAGMPRVIGYLHTGWKAPNLKRAVFCVRQRKSSVRTECGVGQGLPMLQDRHDRPRTCLVDSRSSIVSNHEQQRTIITVVDRPQRTLLCYAKAGFLPGISVVHDCLGIPHQDHVMGARAKLGLGSGEREQRFLGTLRPDADHIVGVRRQD